MEMLLWPFKFGAQQGEVEDQTYGGWQVFGLDFIIDAAGAMQRKMGEEEAMRSEGARF